MIPAHTPKFVYVAVTLPDRRIYYYRDIGDKWVTNLKDATLYLSKAHASPSPMFSLYKLKTEKGALYLEHKWVELA